ncbi:MAG: MFS transporter [Gammaproteobacteria bacterium]|nr:MFS transporter [Gammaproteobacteria bacterium]
MALVMAYAVFAVGYVARPFGGIVFGHLSDVWGRKTGLVLSMMCMGVPLLLLAFLPTYSQIGLTAAFLLIGCRLLQGLSVGGEFPGAITFLAEHASVRHRGVISSLSFVGINIGLLLASGMGWVLTHFLTQAEVSSWGWRVAFFLGSLLAVLGYWIRRHLSETPIFMAEKAQGKIPTLPLMHSLKHEAVRILQGMGVVAIFAVAVPVILIFMPTYLAHYLSHPMSQALMLNTTNALVFICVIPMAAALSDVFGRKLMLLIGCVGFLGLSVLAYHWIQSSRVEAVFAGMLILSVCAAFITGPLIPALAELFKTTSRATSVALAYNLSLALFGGSALVVVTALIARLGNLDAPAWILMGAALVSLLSLLTLRFEHQKPLNE